MSEKAKAESIRQRLKAISVKKSVRYQDVETAFLIERLVVRLLADATLSKRLVFKGGFVGLKVYGSPRYTIDLDALLLQSSVEAALKIVQQQAESDLNDGVWFRLESQVDLQTQGEYGGTRLVFRAGIGELLKNLKRAQIVHFDLGMGDPVVPGPRMIHSDSLIGQESMSWSVYPVETICAEKLHALVSHGDNNSRSKDVHDLAAFLPQAEPRLLREAIKSCFEYRGTEIPQGLSEFVKGLKTTRLKQGWISAMSSVPRSGTFDEVFQSLIAQLESIENQWSS